MRRTSFAVGPNLKAVLQGYLTAGRCRAGSVRIHHGMYACRVQLPIPRETSTVCSGPSPSLSSKVKSKERRRNLNQGRSRLSSIPSPPYCRWPPARPNVCCREDSRTRVAGRRTRWSHDERRRVAAHQACARCRGRVLPVGRGRPGLRASAPLHMYHSSTARCASRARWVRAGRRGRVSR